MTVSLTRPSSPFQPALKNSPQTSLKSHLLKELPLWIYTWHMNDQQIELYLQPSLTFEAQITQNSPAYTKIIRISQWYIYGLPQVSLQLNSSCNLEQVRAFFAATYVTLQRATDGYSLAIHQRGVGGVDHKMLFEAVQKGDLATLQQAFDQDKGLIHTAKEDGTALLHWAVVHGQRDVIVFLLERGASALAVNAYGATPLQLAEQHNNNNLVSLFTKFSAQAKVIQKEKSKALIKALKKGKSTGELQTLLAQGADVNYSKKDKSTPLHIAILKGNKEAVALLLARGANPQTQNDYHVTPIDLAVKKKTPRNPRTLPTLFNANHNF